MIIRTSTSHPLQIASIDLGGGLGRVGVSFCPGKHQSGAMTGAWKRDLGIDLDAVRSWGAMAVITLVEARELKALNVSDMGHAVTARGMRWFHLPIPDVTAPGLAFERAWENDGAIVRGILRSGADVFVHCKGGLGRAGTIAARLLVELGVAGPAEAVRRVRAAHGSGAIETRAQEEHVLGCRPVLKESHAPASVDPTLDRGVGALLGLAVGDAVGTTLEFKPRDSYPPVTDMVGGGPFALDAGVWTDDTAMAVALADSLLACDKLDLADLMSRFVRWWREGTYSPTGKCFDIGITTRKALAHFERSADPVAGSTDPMSAGNGSLMRLAPVAIWGMSHGVTAMREAARAQSSTTHGAPSCLDACEGYALMLHSAIGGAGFDEALAGAAAVTNADPIGPIFAGAWRGKSRAEINSSGYVAHSLEAALWSVETTACFRDAVLTAANLGDDADTTAAIAGQLAGALYGATGIPPAWRDRVAWGPRITNMATALMGR